MNGWLLAACLILAVIGGAQAEYIRILKRQLRSDSERRADR